MTRAVVLGGGGPVGIAWETGLAVALKRAGIDLAAADRIVGTSAGSVVGAHLALGHDLEERARTMYQSGEAPGVNASPDGFRERMAPRMARLMEEMVKAMTSEAPPEQARAELGRFAVGEDTGPEDDFIVLFSDLAGEPWPTSYACTAVDVEDGSFVVWEKADGVPLERAVASSCSVPGVYPPITIGDRRYMDGGMRSTLNADAAAGHDRVVVVSVTASPAEGVTDPRWERLRRQRETELEALRAGGSAVELIGPGPAFLELSGMGMFLMDASRAPAAYEAGLEQGEQEAARIARFWNGPAPS